jgi:hypothetical protein
LISFTLDVGKKNIGKNGTEVLIFAFAYFGLNILHGKPGKTINIEKCAHFLRGLPGKVRGVFIHPRKRSIGRARVIQNYIRRNSRQC